MQGYVKAWGPDHTSTLHTVNNLGVLYKSQGKLDEAEKMYKRALQGYEKVCGPDHTSTLDTVIGLSSQSVSPTGIPTDCINLTYRRTAKDCSLEGLD
jgi:tetratricopeptide (TPR) repeat protein